MANQTRMIWIGLIVAIGFGLTIEALKSTRASADGSSWRPRIFGMQDLEDGEDVIAALHNQHAGKSSHQAQRARSRLLKGRIAGLSNNAALAPAAATIADAVKPAVTPSETDSNLGAPKTINTDDAKKKAEKDAADAKKKKKKKKKKSSTNDAANEPMTAAAPAADSNSHDSAKDVPGGGAGMFRGSGGGISQIRTTIGNPAIDESPETLEEWLTYILRDPNYDRTMKLIEAEQQHKIDSDIFHEVVSEMLADPRLKMHEYAILALGSAPSLKSFILLEAAALQQAEGSELRLQARTYLKAYAKVENIRYLGNAMASNIETSTAYEALRLIQLAVTNYKSKPVSQQPSGTPRTSSLVARQFTSLVPVLTRVVSTSTDASLRQEASQTLQQVQTLVGGANTPAA